jgi:cupin 2 domain-containing protein
MKAKGNILGALPDASAVEVFEPLWKEAGVLIERIVSRGQRSAPETWYEQAQNEWVLLLKGAARLCWEDGSEIALSEGDYVAIPALRKHRVEWTDPNQDTVWLAIHFPTDQ